MTGVSVVGAGICSNVGATLEDFWVGVNAPAPDVQRAQYDIAPEWSLPTYPIGDVPVDGRLAPHELRRLDRPHRLALSAAEAAMDGLDSGDGARWAVCVGTGLGAGQFADEQRAAMLERGPRALSPLTVPLTMPNSVAAHLALRFGLTGPVLTIATACASGANAIGEALWMLRSGRVDRVLAGGVDSLLFPGPLLGFARLGALSTSDDATCSRPFDRARDGFVMGEGAAFVVMARDVEDTTDGVLGRVLGYSANDDAHHLVAPRPDGSGAAQCMSAALADADVDAADVGHVNAHGTSTELNDLSEAAAIRAVFGPSSPPVTATKGVTGHMIGGSGAAELVATLLSCRERQVPPTGGLVDVDERIDIDVVHGDARTLTSGIGLSNSFAFGGHNASIVVEA